jgi:hypothetical protein
MYEEEKMTRGSMDDFATTINNGSKWLSNENYQGKEEDKDEGTAQHGKYAACQVPLFCLLPR